MAMVTTDDDGWYMWQFKYTGKPSPFTVSLPNGSSALPSPTQSMTLKSNGFLVVNFTNVITP